MAKKSIHQEYYSIDKELFVLELLKKSPNMGVTTAVINMCDHFGLKPNSTVERAYRKIFRDRGWAAPDKKSIDQSDEVQAAMSKVFDPCKKRFIITWAQIETALHNLFWENLKAYAEEIDASIHVVAGRYKNPNSLESSNTQKNKESNKSFWAPELRPYLDANRQQIHKYLSILSDVKVQPTAVKPLSGIEGFTGLESSILGHPKVHMRSLPILDGYPNKLMWTTGACTVKNYTDTKIGKRGEFNHQLGFAIVEIDDSVGGFHVRQVQAVDEDGSFYDLFYKVQDGKVRKGVQAAAVILGDIHLGSENKVVLQQALDLSRSLKSENVILHDLFDGHSVNHHEQKNPYILLNREKDGSLDLAAEIEYMYKFLDDNSDLPFTVVRSNHDDFLDRWLINSDWRKSPNKEMYWKLGSIMAEGLAPKGIIPYLIQKRYPHIRVTGYNDSFRVLDWELALHGDKGTNGSRGSINQFKSLNTKTVTAHSHSCGREDGALAVGTMTLPRLGYNQGLSSWMESLVVIHRNSKAQHVNFIKGRYTTLF